MTPDPRLVAALAEAERRVHPGITMTTESWRAQAAAVLPAFLADLRTLEWLAERLALLPAELQGASRLQAVAILGTGDRLT